MSKHLSWKSGYHYCEAKNKKGEPCGNTVPRHIRLCHVHRRMADRARVLLPKEQG